MVKAIEAIIIITLLIFAFFAGVKYSDSIKNHASWLFENKEEEVELPDLSNENVNEVGSEIGTTTNEGESVSGEAAAVNEMPAPQDASAPAAPVAEGATKASTAR